MEFMSLDSVGITLRSDGMCFSSYASDTSTLVALPDTDLRVWSDLSTEDLHLLQEFLLCYFPQLTSWLEHLFVAQGVGSSILLNHPKNEM